MKQSFNSCLVLKLQLEKLLKQLNTSQPYNIFCHHINEEKTKNMEQTINDIFEKGLKCNYSSTSRTLTYMGTNENVNINRLFKYIYISNNIHVRNNFILAIPKSIKTSEGLVDYSTPEIPQHNSKFRQYSLLDYTKETNLNPSFNLACIKIDETTKNFELITNENHLLLCSQSDKNKQLNIIRQQISNYKQSQK